MVRVRLLGALALLAFAVPASGALITSALVSTTGLPPEPLRCDVTGTDSASIACGPAAVFGNALAVADYGSLGVLAESHVDYTVTPCDPSPYPSCGGLNQIVGASAGFTDTLTVSHPTLGGTSAFIAFTWALSGFGSLTTVDPSGGLVTFLDLALFGFFNDAVFSHHGFGVQQNGSLAMAGFEVTTPYQSITLGSPFEIGFSLLGRVNLGGSAPLGVPLSVEGSLAFNNTASLTGVLLTDELGNPLTDFFLGAASESSYPRPPPAPAQVPEPASGLLMLAGMALLHWRRRQVIKSGG
jgi:hypothetical protein